MAIGFSHHTALPAAAARWTRSAWTVEVDVIATASTRSSARAASMSLVESAPSGPASRWAASPNGSATTTSSTGADEREPDRALSVGGHGFSLN
jgi:hypothetical protein